MINAPNLIVVDSQMILTLELSQKRERRVDELGCCLDSTSAD